MCLSLMPNVGKGSLEIIREQQCLWHALGNNAALCSTMYAIMHPAMLVCTLSRQGSGPKAAATWLGKLLGIASKTCFCF